MTWSEGVEGNAALLPFCCYSFLCPVQMKEAPLVTFPEFVAKQFPVHKLRTISMHTDHQYIVV